MTDSKKHWQDLEKDVGGEPVTLGRYMSHTYANDPKRIAFVAARYKFAAKMLDGCKTAIEVGCGDGFGAPIVADAVGALIGTDINEDMLADIRGRLSFVENASFEYVDFREGPYSKPVNAIYLIDVIEHIAPKEEAGFMENLAASLEDHGVLLIGTPNKTADQYASEWSKKGHINLKTHETLKKLGEAYFQTVFMFGMNDEVIHTGFPAMSHFLWALCVTPKGC
ncbi:MAG: class I SAM-dependent methyltransferase [Rhodospirillales bacterium]|nr:class I SAM-dependent methyltransferase [Rhodospirillales bacterium]